MMPLVCWVCLAPLAAFGLVHGAGRMRSFAGLKWPAHRAVRAGWLFANVRGLVLRRV